MSAWEKQELPGALGTHRGQPWPHLASHVLHRNDGSSSRPSWRSECQPGFPQHPGRAQTLPVLSELLWGPFCPAPHSTPDSATTTCCFLTFLCLVQLLTCLPASDLPSAQPQSHLPCTSSGLHLRGASCYLKSRPKHRVQFSSFQLSSG